MLVITATSTEGEANVGHFYNTLIELGLLAGTVIVLAGAIWILRHSAARYVVARDDRRREDASKSEEVVTSEELSS